MKPIEARDQEYFESIPLTRVEVPEDAPLPLQLKVHHINLMIQEVSILNLLHKDMNQALLPYTKDLNRETIPAFIKAYDEHIEDIEEIMRYKYHVGEVFYDGYGNQSEDPVYNRSFLIRGLRYIDLMTQIATSLETRFTVEESLQLNESSIEQLSEQLNDYSHDLANRLSELGGDVALLEIVTTKRDIQKYTSFFIEAMEKLSKHYSAFPAVISPRHSTLENTLVPVETEPNNIFELPIKSLRKAKHIGLFIDDMPIVADELQKIFDTDNTFHSLRPSKRFADDEVSDQTLQAFVRAVNQLPDTILQRIHIISIDQRLRQHYDIIQVLVDKIRAINPDALLLEHSAAPKSKIYTDTQAIFSSYNIKTLAINFPSLLRQNREEQQQTLQLMTHDAYIAALKMDTEQYNSDYNQDIIRENETLTTKHFASFKQILQDIGITLEEFKQYFTGRDYERQRDCLHDVLHLVAKIELNKKHQGANLTRLKQIFGKL